MKTESWMFISFTGAAALAAALGPVIRALGARLGMVDRPTGRKCLAGAAVPQTGGILIFLAMWAMLMPVMITAEPGPSRTAMLTLLVGGFLMLVVGAIDDRCDISARAKFLVTVAVAGWVTAQGLRIEQVALPGLEPISLGSWAVPLTIIWVVGVTNAVNLIDGANGLAAGVSAVVATASAVMAMLGGEPVLAAAGLAMAGACAGFLPHNFRRRRLFLGDAGSLFAGISLAILALSASAGSDGGGSFWVPVLLLGYPTMDTVLVMLRRWLRGKSIFSPDQGHLHHVLLNRGLSHGQCAAVAAGLASLFCLIGLGLAMSSPLLVGGAMLTMGVVMGWGARWLRYHRVLAPVDLRDQKQRFRAAHHIAQLAQIEISRAANQQQLLDVLERAAARLNVQSIEIQRLGEAPLPAVAATLPGTLVPLPDGGRHSSSEQEVMDVFTFPGLGLRLRVHLPINGVPHDVRMEHQLRMEQLVNAFATRLSALEPCTEVSQTVESPALAQDELLQHHRRTPVGGAI